MNELVRAAANSKQRGPKFESIPVQYQFECILFIINHNSKSSFIIKSSFIKSSVIHSISIHPLIESIHHPEWRHWRELRETRPFYPQNGRCGGWTQWTGRSLVRETVQFARLRLRGVSTIFRGLPGWTMTGRPTSRLHH